MAETIHIVVADPAESERSRIVQIASDLASERGLDVEIHEADDGEQAAKLVAEHGAKLLVCEILLDGLSGLSLMRRLDKQDEAEAPRVVFVTSMTRDFDRYWALRLGAHGYVMKPYDDATLRERILNVLEGGAAAKPQRPTLLP